MSGRQVILIVEDHDSTRKALSKLLRLRGWDVLEAATVSEGLAMLSQRPDGVLLDLMLPDGDGETVLNRVRESNLSIPVAVTTGVNDEARLNAIRALKPSAMLIKPIDSAALWSAFGPGGSATS